MKHSERIQRLLDDPCASNWLKDALKSSIDRDLVDAANDAEVLAQILAERADSSFPKDDLARESNHLSN